MDKCADCGCAEAVADEIDLLNLACLVKFAPVGNIARESLTVALVAHLLRVNLTEVYATALNESVEDACAVSHTGERSYVRCISLCSLFHNRVTGIAVPHAECGKERTEF